MRTNRWSRTSRVATVAGGLVAAMFTAHCADPDVRSDDRIVRRDSAGVDIIEVPAAAVGELPRLTLAPEPDLRIGAVEGEDPYLFGSAAYAQTLSDGSIAVLERSSRTVRFFSADGRFLTEAGGDGEGPGEFHSPYGLAVLPGDTILVWDARLRRITRLTAAGGMAGISTVEAPGLNESFVGAFDDGSVVLRWRWLSFGTVESNRHLVVRVSRAAERLDTLLNVPMVGKLIMAFGRPRFETEFLAPTPSITTGPSAVWWANGGLWEVQRFDPDGSLDRIIRVAQARRPITREFFERLADSLAFEGPWPEEEKPEIRRMFDRRGVADSLPSVALIRAGTDGRIWMRSYEYPGEGLEAATWLVVEPDGTPVAWAELPRRFTPYEFGPDHVLGVGRDSMNVQYIERYLWVERQRGRRVKGEL